MVGTYPRESAMFIDEQSFLTYEKSATGGTSRSIRLAEDGNGGCVADDRNSVSTSETARYEGTAIFAADFLPRVGRRNDTRRKTRITRVRRLNIAFSRAERGGTSERIFVR